MKENRENKPVLKYLAVLLSLVLTGCGTIGLAQESTFESAYENGKEDAYVILHWAALFGLPLLLQ